MCIRDRYKTFYILKNDKTNEVLTVNQDDYVNDKKYWEEGSPWKIEEGKTTSKIVKQGYESEIAKFKPESPEGMDLTEEILKAPKAVLIFSYHPENVDPVLLAKTEAKVKEIKAVSYTHLDVYKRQIEDNSGATLVSEGIDANYFDMLNYAVFCLIKMSEEQEKFETKLI